MFFLKVVCIAHKLRLDMPSYNPPQQRRQATYFQTWPSLLSLTLYEITPCVILSAECSNHALPCSPLFKHKSTRKADFLLLRGNRFLLSTEEPGQNNNCWQIVPGNIQHSFACHFHVSPLQFSLTACNVTLGPYQMFIRAINFFSWMGSIKCMGLSA